MTNHRISSTTAKNKQTGEKDRKPTLSRSKFQHKQVEGKRKRKAQSSPYVALLSFDLFVQEKSRKVKENFENLQENKSIPNTRARVYLNTIAILFHSEHTIKCVKFDSQIRSPPDSHMKTLLFPSILCSVKWDLLLLITNCQTQKSPQ